MALVLVVAGLTGAILPFQRDLNRLAAPEVWAVEPPGPNAKLLSGIELKQRVEAQTGGIVTYVTLAIEEGYATAVFVAARPGAAPLGYNEVIVDPYTGTVRRRVQYGNICEGMVNLMPFLVQAHYSLAAGKWGRLAFGAAAVLWCAECLLGLWVTLPKPGRKRGLWLGRWAPAWRLRIGQGRTAFLYDLHRAAGLWLLPVMLIFAWSGVAFNLQQVHTPVQRLLGAEGLYHPPTNDAPAFGTMSDVRALERGRVLMAQEAARRGFAVIAPAAITWNTSAKAIGYYALTSLDGPTRRGSTLVWFDAGSGRQLEFRPPYGATPADAVDKATRLLHVADLFGWPYKIFVSIFGLLASGMAMAAVVLWLRRSVRLASSGRTRRDALSATP
jgi:uncharacterized iron-regulated membrane protein